VPTYDYRCTACGREIEVVHGIHAAGPSSCEVCGGAMRKALSPPAIHFRGGGWAKKDAKAASASKAPTASSAPGDKKPADAAGSAGTSSNDGLTGDAVPATTSGSGEAARSTGSKKTAAGTSE
jgi:putative FmdB family regulatory protein